MEQTIYLVIARCDGSESVLHPAHLTVERAAKQRQQLEEEYNEGRLPHYLNYDKVEFEVIDRKLV